MPDFEDFGDGIGKSPKSGRKNSFGQLSGNWQAGYRTQMRMQGAEVEVEAEVWGRGRGRGRGRGSGVEEGAMVICRDVQRYVDMYRDIIEMYRDMYIYADIYRDILDV
jgi:hypothetical protein